MGKNTAPQMSASTSNTAQFSELKSQNEQLQQQAAAFQQVAQSAANKLIQIDQLLAPQLSRKPNFLNIFFHFKEILSTIIQIIDIIKEFKDQFIRKPDAPTDGTAQ